MVNFANGFAERGHEVLLVFGSAGVYEEEISPGVTSIDLNSDRALACLLPLINTIDQQRPDWLISTLGYANIVAIWATLLSTHRPKIAVREAFTLSGGTIKEALITAYQAQVYHHADLVVAPSVALVQELSRIGINAQLVPNPTISNDLEKLSLKRFSWPRPYVLAVGRLADEKGFDTLIRAWKEDPLPGADLIILGDGPLRQELESLATDLGVSGRVYFPGFVENPFKYMRRCSVFVLSSRREGLPNVLIQALACGAKVVATDCPTGPREILGTQNQIGELVAVDSPSAMAQAIQKANQTSYDIGLIEQRLRDYTEVTATERFLELLEI